MFAAIAITMGAGCASPVLTRDGQLVFQQHGAKGAMVLTANGVELLDRTEKPKPIIRRSANDPWVPPVGFILPADGILRETSTPIPIQARGLLVVLRSSDVRVPSWGGEILVRIDAIAPAAAFPNAASSVRAPLALTLVIDGRGKDTLELAEAAIERAGEADRVSILDALGARVVLPPVPGSHRTLLRGAVDRLVAQQRSAGMTRDLAGALAKARDLLPPIAAKRVLVLTDRALPKGSSLDHAIAALANAGAGVVAVASRDLAAGSLDAFSPANAEGARADRVAAIEAAIPPPGDVVLDDVALSVGSAPAPARVVEVSGGSNALGLYADHLSFGEMYAGEARTEVARVMIPPWVPGEPLDITVKASYRVVATGLDESASVTLRCRYVDDIVEIAEARHGDVIAYASALAMVRRLHRAFLGSEADKLGGLRPLVSQQAISLAALGRARSDQALVTQSDVLTSLLGVIDD